MYKCKYCNEEFETVAKLGAHCSKCDKNPIVFSFFKCEFCGLEIRGKKPYTRHKNHCHHNPNRLIPKTELDEIKYNPSKCQYCGKECKNDNSLRNHERLCKENPNRDLSSSIGKDNLQEYRNKLHTHEISPWNKGLTKDTDIRVLKGQQKLILYYEDPAHHITSYRHSPEILTKFNRYHSSKRGIYQDILFMSTWELAYYLYMKDQGHNIIRCEDWYEYEIEGIVHRYNPDFIVDDTQIVEIKGYKTDIDNIKWKCIPNLIIINKNKIKPFIKYVKDKYQVEKLEDLYDRRIN